MRRIFLFKLVSISAAILICILLSEIFLRYQNFVDLDSPSPLYPPNQILHHGTDRFEVTFYGSNCKNETLKILLLGDSWMEEKGLSKTIEKGFANKAEICVQAINGGTGSYAPTTYLLKARQAYNQYGKFDYVIVNIDETDIGDEWLRYRLATVRDKSGKIVAVPFDRDLASQYVLNGKLWAESSNLYLIRLIRYAFYYKILVPFIYRPTYFPEYSSIMKYVFSPNDRNHYKKEHDHFERRLFEMVSELVAYTSRPKFVYVTHHPHYRGLTKKVKSGKKYLPIVSESLERVKSKTGVNVLDSRDYIKNIHGEHPLIDNFRKNDPFSHLARDAEIRYGKWIVSQIYLE